MEELSSIKGLGPKTLESLKNININTIEDLVSYYPYRHDLIVLDDIKTAVDKQNVIIECIVDSVPLTRRFRANMTSLMFRAMSNKKMIAVMIFNRAFLKTQLKPGTTITVIGKYDALKNTVIASDIKFEKIKTGSIETVYHLTSGLTSKTLKKAINEALLKYDNYIDYVPDYLNDKYKFITKKDAVNLMHNPTCKEDVKNALMKLKYEELFLFMFKINYLKEINKISKTGYIRNIDPEDVNDFIRTLPFELTNDQNKAVEDIYNDMTSSRRMNRMLQGDVGSGKTIISIIAAYINHLAKYQTALMAPTEVLAYQHYDTVKTILESSNIRVALLVGSMKKKEKDEIVQKLENGKIDFIIGTHALLSENVIFKNLGLVITDEQHRFGVNQRTILKNKSNYPEILMMSATPIPRTYALTIYGDTDVSSIKTKPEGRLPVITKVVKEENMKEVLEGVYSALKKGNQAYVIAPMIEESEDTDYTNVFDLKRKFEMAFKNYNVGIMHGKMTVEEKDDVMNSYRLGKIDILISTTVIEVGVDVKNASVIVIFDADRFGLSTLHQLRGRVGRNSIQSYCYLISNKDKERLKIMEKENDGYKISEADFKLRGQGDLFGNRQSGALSFKLSDVKKDYDLLVKVRDDVNKLFER